MIYIKKTSMTFLVTLFFVTMPWRFIFFNYDTDFIKESLNYLLSDFVSITYDKYVSSSYL